MTAEQILSVVVVLFLAFGLGPYNFRMGLRMRRDPEQYQRMAETSGHPLAPFWALPKAVPWIRRVGLLVMAMGVFLVGFGLWTLAPLALG